MKAFEMLREKLEEYIETAKAECDWTYIKPFEIAKNAINDVEKEYNNGWIPCSVRLPDDELEDAIKERGAHAVFPVLATVRRKKDIIVSKAFYSSYGGKHFIDLHTENLDVIAWQPLPKPYEVLN